MVRGGEKGESEGEEGEEAVRVEMKKAPQMPSKEEVEEHNITHIPFRDWCPHCIRGKAMGEPHSSKKLRGTSVPMIVMDYMNMKKAKEKGKDKDQEKKEEEEQGERRFEDMPILAVRGRQSGFKFAHVAPKKGWCQYA